jgi:hypothetical protein
MACLLTPNVKITGAARPYRAASASTAGLDGWLKGSHWNLAPDRDGLAQHFNALNLMQGLSRKI